MLAGVGLGVLFCSVFLPVFMLWLGDLLIGDVGSAHSVSAPAGYRLIPLAVWLMIRVVFSLLARGFRVQWQVIAAFVVIATVTVGMQVGLRQFGMYLFIPAP